MRLPTLVVCVLTVVYAARAQDAPVSKLLEPIRAALTAKRGDAEVATLIDQAKLSERLEDAVIEQLQTEGAGPMALEALDRQKERTRTLAPRRNPYGSSTHRRLPRRTSRRRS